MIATEIARLQQAKADIRTAIQAKGVTVPSSAKLDDYDTYVAQISGGGGTPNLQRKTVDPATTQQVVRPDTGYDGLEQVTVTAVRQQQKSVTPSATAQQVTPDSGMFLVQVNVAATPLQSKHVAPTTAQQDVTPDAGYVGLSKVSVDPVTLQTKTATQNGDVTPDNGYMGLSKVTVNVPQGATLNPTAGDYPVVENANVARIASTSLTTTGISITIPVTGTYRLKWTAFRSSTSGTNSSQLYRRRNGSTQAIGSAVTSWTNSYYQNNTLDIACNAGDEIIVYARSRGTSYYVVAGNLSACVAQKLWTN